MTTLFAVSKFRVSFPSRNRLDLTGDGPEGEPGRGAQTQSLEPLGERADAFVDTLLAEGESTRRSGQPNSCL